MAGGRQAARQSNPGASPWADDIDSAVSNGTVKNEKVDGKSEHQVKAAVSKSAKGQTKPATLA